MLKSFADLYKSKFGDVPNGLILEKEEKDEDVVDNETEEIESNEEDKTEKSKDVENNDELKTVYSEFEKDIEEIRAIERKIKEYEFYKDNKDYVKSIDKYEVQALYKRLEELKNKANNLTFKNNIYQSLKKNGFDASDRFMYLYVQNTRAKYIKLLKYSVKNLINTLLYLGYKKEDLETFQIKFKGKIKLYGISEIKAPFSKKNNRRVTDDISQLHNFPGFRTKSEVKIDYSGKSHKRYTFPIEYSGSILKLDENFLSTDINIRKYTMKKDEVIETTDLNYMEVDFDDFLRDSGAIEVDFDFFHVAGMINGKSFYSIVTSADVPLKFFKPNGNTILTDYSVEQIEASKKAKMAEKGEDYDSPENKIFGNEEDYKKTAQDYYNDRLFGNNKKYQAKFWGTSDMFKGDYDNDEDDETSGEETEEHKKKKRKNKLHKKYNLDIRGKNYLYATQNESPVDYFQPKYAKFFEYVDHPELLAIAMSYVVHRIQIYRWLESTHKNDMKEYNRIQTIGAQRKRGYFYVPIDVKYGAGEEAEKYFQQELEKRRAESNFTKEVDADVIEEPLENEIEVNNPMSDVKIDDKDIDIKDSNDGSDNEDFRDKYADDIKDEEDIEDIDNGEEDEVEDEVEDNKDEKDEEIEKESWKKLKNKQNRKNKEDLYSYGDFDEEDEDNF